LALSALLVFSAGPTLAQRAGEAAAEGAGAVSQQVSEAAPKEGTIMQKIHGEFEVKLTPQADDSAGETGIGRMVIDKKFFGDLAGTSQGQMLAAGTAVEGSAGYVALEKVTATLEGRSGTFVLQHSGTLSRGEPLLTVTVVPDSATGQLAGLAGRMTIEIEDGKHFYGFEFTLPDLP
jgi:hypothetical protein